MSKLHNKTRVLELERLLEARALEVFRLDEELTKSLEALASERFRNDCLAHSNRQKDEEIVALRASGAAALEHLMGARL